MLICLDKGVKLWIEQPAIEHNIHVMWGIEELASHEVHSEKFIDFLPINLTISIKLK